MTIYRIHLTDARKIQASEDDLIGKCKLLYPGPVMVYRSPVFVQGTGYTQTVEGEIDLVFASNGHEDLVIADKEAFISAWGFDRYRSYRIDQLSGGWRKYLGIALFTNLKADVYAYFDSTRQLSDRLIGMLFDNLHKIGQSAAFFFEWDAMILKATEAVVLFDTEQGFSRTPGEIECALAETNYD